MTALPTGLCGFPLTPFARGEVDRGTYARLIGNLAGTVDSIGALGSTGSYMYLTPRERWEITDLTLEHAGATPVLVGIGDMSLRQVLKHADAAASAGAAGLLLAPVGYQKLTGREVFELFRAVTGSTDLPVVVYDNPLTTGVTFDLSMYQKIAELPGIASFKIPPIAGDPVQVARRLQQIHEVLPEHVQLGISGDAAAASALSAGIGTWYSVLGGTFPDAARRLLLAAQAGAEQGLAANSGLQPIWDLFAAHGSLRSLNVLAASAGLVPGNCLPAPLLPPDVAAADIERCRRLLS